MTRLTTRSGAALRAVLAGVATIGIAGAAGAQSAPCAQESSGVVESSPRQAELAKRRERVALEKELKRLRATHFGDIKRAEIRQAGILKLRAYTDPALFQTLIDVFQREGADVRAALLNHLADQQSVAGDAAIARMAVFGTYAPARAEAAAALRDRLAKTRGPSDAIRTVVYEGLTRGNEDTIKAAADLANIGNMWQFIPMLAAAQIGSSFAGTNQGGTGDGRGAMAQIYFANQQAFVSDLTPVVSESAVAFDPELSVVTEGTILRVFDAVVVTYRSEVHTALVDLSSRFAGAPTGHLGWDQKAWAKWIAQEFKPRAAARREADKLAQAKEAGDVAGAKPAAATGSGG